MNKRKMLEPDTATVTMRTPPPPHSASPSSPPPRSLQVHLTSPEITKFYKPSTVKRMQEEECHVCHRIGHWSWHCPLRLNNNSSNKRLSSSPKFGSPSNPKNIYCRCGHGFCIVKTSRAAKKYYSCPIIRGKRCTEFVKFCDSPIDESFLQPPPYKYPECGCGAGVCEKVEDPDMVGKNCFTCPVPKGHGKCDYKVSEDELLHNNNSIFPIQQSSQEQYNLGEQGDLRVEQSKRIRMMDGIETPLSSTVSELPEGDNATTAEVTPSRRVGFPEFPVEDDLQEVVNSVPGISSHQSTQRTSCRKKLFENNSFPDASADASFGQCPRSWLGRLVFLSPAQSLKFPATQPIFCSVPTQAITFDDNFKCNKQLAVTNISENAPPPLNGCQTEVCGDVLGRTEVSRAVIVSPSQSQGSQRKPMSKAERERRMALVLQQCLLTNLEDMDPHDIESMRMAAEETFVLLNRLSVDYKLFSEHIQDFINHATSVADIEKSMKNFVPFEECNRGMEAERARFSQMQKDCVKTEALLKESNRRKQCLDEEVSHLEAMLDEKRKQLNSCEEESLKIEAQLVNLETRMVETNKVLKGRIEEAELARKLNQEKETKHMIAKAALEKAKLELIN